MGSGADGVGSAIYCCVLLCGLSTSLSFRILTGPARPLWNGSRRTEPDTQCGVCQMLVAAVNIPQRRWPVQKYGPSSWTACAPISTPARTSCVLLR